MIIPISYPVFNEAGIVKIANEVLGKSISSTFDGQIKPLVLLSRLFNGDNELQGVREAGALLRHLSYGFFIIDVKDTIMKLIAESSCPFKVIDTLRIDMQALLMTGTMQQWCETLINCLSPSTSYEVRFVMNEIMDHFDSLGLHHIFAYYRRRKLTDTTYVLEDKR